MVDDRGKAGWSVEGDRAPGLVIGIQDALSSGTEGTVGLHVEEELVGQVRVGRHPSSEPESRELLVRVVVLDHFSDGLDGQRVGVVAAGVAVVQRARVGDLAVGGGEVNADGELFRHTKQQSVQEQASPIIRLLFFPDNWSID